VRSASRGMVILAESKWREKEWFSTSSVRGGNAVIVFDADRDLFYRYAHLESVSAAAGVLVEAGDEIGAVGHTGFNASLQGHGRHLHFEMNEFDPRSGLVTAIGHDDLEALLEAARGLAGRGVRDAAFPESVGSTDPQTAPE
jgi:murein DD-endopeptidase MepM/ murein hydrolase activator NlpD